jgi:hypothetical protein
MWKISYTIKKNIYDFDIAIELRRHIYTEIIAGKFICSGRVLLMMKHLHNRPDF